MHKIEVNKIATFTGHKDCVYSLEPGALHSAFYSAGGDGMVVAWDLRFGDLGKLVTQVNNSIYAIHFDKEKNVLYVAENFSGIHAIDLISGKEYASVSLGNHSIFDIKKTTNYLFIAQSDGVLTLCDPKDLSVFGRIKISESSLRNLFVNANSNELAIASSDHSIYILSLSDLSLKKRIQAHTNSVFALACSPDSKYLISASRDAHLKVWNLSDYSLCEDVVAHMFAINHLTYAPDGKYFATCSMDKTIKIWSADFKLIKVLDKARHAGHGTSVNKLLWLDDALVSCSDDRSISVWKIENKDLIVNS